MKLLRELNEEVKITIEESVGSEKRYFIEGVYLQSELKNKNGRLYPEHVMDKAVQIYTEDFIKTSRSLGELTHPASPVVDPRNASHLIVSLVKEGTNYIGKSKILNTPMGKTVQALLADGVSLGVSSRALGSLKMNNEGVQIVQDDFIISTAADIVTDPSAPDAFVRGIMESKDWIYIDGRFEERQIEETKKYIKSIPSRRLQEAKILAFQYYLNQIK